MTKVKEKKHILGKKQLQIILFLGENGSHTINGTNTQLFSLSHYHATHTAFKSLEKKGLIKKLAFKEKKRYPQFWLTVNGSIEALLNGANIEKVKQNALNLCTDNEEREALEVFFGIAKSLGPETAKKMYKFLLTRNFELSFLPIDETEINKALSIAKKYPKYWKLTEEKIERMINVMRKVLSHE